MNILYYWLMCVTPKKHLPLVMFVIGGVLLASVQIHKQVFYFGINGLDLPMTMMFGYCRVTSLACCIKDGETMKVAEKKKQEPDLKPREKAFAVSEVPTIFEFTSYMYFCGAPISGPWLEYKDLMQFFRKEGHYKDVEKTHTFKPGMIRFVQAWIFVAISGVLGNYF
jgi:hypothetical protein